MNIRYGILIVVIMISMSAPSSATNLTWDSVQTAYQINNFTIPANGSYIGGIKIYDIDSTNLSSITVVSTSYRFIVTFQNQNIWGLLPRTLITTNYTDYINGLSENHSFIQTLSGTEDIIFLPEFVQDTGLMNGGNGVIIAEYVAYYSKSSGFDYYLLRRMDIINNMGFYNSSTEKLIVSPSKNVQITVIGMDNVNIEYILGTKEQISESLLTYDDIANPLPGVQSWFSWMISHIPFIGTFLLQAIVFLTTFFTIIFSTLTFLVLDFDITLLTVMSIGMIHGIIVMSRGNSTPVDGVTTTITDIYSFFKMIFVAIIMFFELVWRIVQAIATIKP